MGPQIRFMGALLLAFCFAGFVWWDCKRPRAEGETQDRHSLSQLLNGGSSYGGPRKSYASLDDAAQYQAAHLEKFRANVGRREGDATLQEVSYFAEGANMSSDSDRQVICRTEGYYYVARRSGRILPCGASSGGTSYEFCGSSPTWDKK